MFKLSKKEKQEVVTNCDHLKNLKYSPVLPYAFTEHGALQAANVLNSALADQKSVYIIRAFVTMREMLKSQKNLWEKITALEKKFGTHDLQIKKIFEAIKELHQPTLPERKPIGFRMDDYEK